MTGGGPGYSAPDAAMLGVDERTAGQITRWEALETSSTRRGSLRSSRPPEPHRAPKGLRYDEMLYLRGVMGVLCCI
jgi:hypothetical protein